MSKAPPNHPDHGVASPNPSSDPNPPTIAAFSPTTLSGSSLTSKQRSTIIVHKKSPLLVATPPQVTRALAYSHPFLLPLNKLVGLISWSSGDPWESFLLVSGFWAVVLYGDQFIRWVGPILLVIGLILGMYSRRYSPLSAIVMPEEKGHKRDNSEGVRHQKSLDEIVETLRTFTTRCNILLEPFLELTDFLSTQTTATTATTRPALTALFIRILLVTPIWVLLTLPPLYLITTKRVILFCGTLILTWHSRPARISRVILWRSRTFRWICSAATGFTFSDQQSTPKSDPETQPPKLPPRTNSQQHLIANNLATKKQRRADSAGVRFTFILYENQRRWLGIGWTYSLIASERSPWTDEYLNPAPSKDEFELPEVDGGNAKWRWVEGSEWRVEGVSGAKGGKSSAKDDDEAGWIYYDNKVCTTSCLYSDFAFEHADIYSGTMAAAVKTHGVATPVAANGTATPNLSKSPAATQLLHLRQHPKAVHLATFALLRTPT